MTDSHEPRTEGETVIDKMLVDPTHPHDGYAYDGCYCVCCTNVRALQVPRRAAICGVVIEGGPFGEPLACGYPPNPDGEPMHEHSWGTLPTFAHAPNRNLPIEMIEKAVDRMRELVAWWDEGGVIDPDDGPPVGLRAVPIVRALAALEPM